MGSEMCIRDRERFTVELGPSFLMLPREAMEISGVDIDILEYLTMPESAQSLEPEMWNRVWTCICEEKENDWLELRKEGDGDEMKTFPFCTLCNKAVKMITHFAGDGCKKQQEGRKHISSPLLAEIIKIAQAKVEKRAVTKPPPAEGLEEPPLEEQVSACCD